MRILRVRRGDIHVLVHEHRLNRFEKYLDVKPKGNVICVVDVVVDLLFRGRRIAKVRLIIARYAGRDVKSALEFRRQLVVALVMRRQMGARTDQTHRPAQYVEQLRRFVEARLS